MSTPNYNGGFSIETRNSLLVTKLLQKIYHQMYKLLRREYSTFIPNILYHLRFLPVRTLLSIYGRLQYVYEIKDLKLKWTLNLRGLINSINVIVDLDSHPIGLEIAIEFQQYATQNILNVKRLNTNKTSNDETIKLREIPILDRTHLYENDNIVWVRVAVVKNYLEKIDELLKTGVVEGYQKMYKFNDTIAEYYFTNLKCKPVLEFFDRNENVLRIIFYSNCKSFKRYCSNPLAIVSNILKFYYCNSTSNIDFDMLSMKNSRSLLYNYIMAILFYMKNNLKVSLRNGSTTPLSILSGNNPRHNINTKSSIFEPMDAYDELCLKNNVDLSTTPMSVMSMAVGNVRHKLHEVCSDRDARLMSGGSIIGGRNQHELVTYIDDNLTLEELADIAEHIDSD